MPLIKSNVADHLARSAIVLDLGDLQRQGALLIKQARDQAEAELAQARAGRARILAGASDQGRAEGFAKGLEEGRRKGVEDAYQAALNEHRQKLETLEANWSSVLAEFAAQREVLIQQATEDVVALALAIARRVIKRSIECDPNIVVDQVAAALAVVTRPTEVQIAVHPDDRPLVADALPGLLAALPMIRHAEVIEDKKAQRAGCVVRTRGDRVMNDVGGGEIDASIQTQIDRIVELLVPQTQTPPPDNAGSSGNMHGSFSH